MIYWYKHKDKYLFSFCDGYGFCKSSEGEALSNTEELYFLTKLPKGKSKKSFAATCIQDLMIDEENLDLLKIKKTDYFELCPEIINLMGKGRVKAVNTNYDGYEGLFFMEEKKKKRVNILALGDVGSTLLMGLKLLGHSCIESIGIYDRSIEKLNRWEYEMNQTSLPLEFDALPEVRIIGRDELFNCEMFVFCASKGVPPVGSDVRDVRMVQYDENRKLIRDYAVMAGDKKFKGIFAVVSDPVDLLCKAVLDESSGNLSPEQIKGYGLGVMNARAAYYAKKQIKFSQFLNEGRSFGPHGQGLVIADSIKNYNDCLSRELTELTVKANLEVRKTGFKPYVAPALSSGALSIIYTLEGKYHYSSNYIGGVYMGALNRNLLSGLEIEKINMPVELFERLKVTYDYLERFN